MSLLRKIKPTAMRCTAGARRQALRLVLTCICLGPAAAASQQQDPGKQLYEFYCYQCHAYAGNANTVAASYLSPRPRDFTRADPDVLTREKMLSALRNGRPGTAMTSFSRVLSDADMSAVIDYVRSTLMSAKGRGLAYHTAQNGWEDHQRYEAAFDFATGEVPIDTAWEELTARQRRGKKLFLDTCISCHEGARSSDQPLRWEPKAVSYPRSTDTCVDCHVARPPELLPDTSPRPLAADFGTSPYLVHGQGPPRGSLTQQQARGHDLFLANCAFCHAADGSGRNWIGSFLLPRPRDLRPQQLPAHITSARLVEVIRDGIPGTSMPAWKSVLSPEAIDDLAAFLSRPAANAQRGPLTGASASAPSASSSLRWSRQRIK